MMHKTVKTLATTAPSAVVSLGMRRAPSKPWPADLSEAAKGRAAPKPRQGDWARVSKAAAGAVEQRYVLGPVLVPGQPGPDGIALTADDIEAAAWSWAANNRNLAVNHGPLANDRIQFVESQVVRADQTIGGVPIKAGTWMLGAIVKDDELWQAVKDGKLTGWELGPARGARPPAA